MGRIIDEAETWKLAHPELVLPREVDVGTSMEEGIASAAVHAAATLSELLSIFRQPKFTKVTSVGFSVSLFDQASNVFFKNLSKLVVNPLTCDLGPFSANFYYTSTSSAVVDVLVASVELGIPNPRTAGSYVSKS